MFKRDGRIYTQIVKNCSANELIPILSEFSELDESVIYSDCRKAYDGLVDYTALAHYRVKHSKNEFLATLRLLLYKTLMVKNHINGIENILSKRARLISSKQSTVKRKRATICVATAY